MGQRLRFIVQLSSLSEFYEPAKSALRAKTKESNRLSVHEISMENRITLVKNILENHPKNILLYEEQIYLLVTKQDGGIATVHLFCTYEFAHC